MAKTTLPWKKGPGKLGALLPLIGTWTAQSDSPMGRVKCTRTFTSVLNGKYIRLDAHWQGPNIMYEELALFGVQDGTLTFWSFTSDGKRSEGHVANGSDIHPKAICFEAEMPAGLARMIYWPHQEGGFNWAVEAKSPKGWRRFTEHLYRPA
jgi:hypothetical protein